MEGKKDRKEAGRDKDFDSMVAVDKRCDSLVGEGQVCYLQTFDTYHC